MSFFSSILNFKKYTQTEKKFFIYTILSSFWIHTPIWVLFFLSKGYSLLDIAFINMFFWLSIVVFEIPTGYIADYFGRKISLFFSYLVQAFAIGLFVISINLFPLIISQVLWGLGITMSSGAETAWLYDEIEYDEINIKIHTKEESNERFQVVWGSMSGIGHLSLAISQVVGGLLATIALYLPHTIISIIFLIVAIIVLFIPEHRFEQSTHEKDSSTKEKISSPSISKAIKEYLMPIVLALSIIVIIIGSLLDIRYFMQKDLSTQGLSYSYIGVYFALIMIAISLGNYSSKYVTDNFLKDKVYLILAMIMGICFILMGFSPLFTLLFIFLIINFCYGVLSPLLSKNINKFLSSENRATVLSIMSALTKVSFIVFQILISWIIINTNFDIAYLVTGFLMIVFLVPSSVYLLKKRVTIQ